MNVRPLISLVALGLLSSLQQARADSFLYANGVVTTIQIPGVPSSQVYANGINNQGDIVGYFDDSRGAHGFLDDHGTFTTLNGPSQYGAGALGIDDNRNIVGWFFNPTPSYPYLYANGVYTILNQPLAQASGINNSDQIVGSGVSGSFLYVNGQYQTVTVPGASSTTAQSINNSGQIAGSFSDRAGTHGFINTGTNFVVLDLPGGAGTTSAFGINDAGQTVGWAVVNNVVEGFEYSAGAYTEIAFPGAMNIEPTGINNSGEVVGTYFPVAVAVPEPSSLLSLALGLILIGGLVAVSKSAP